MTVDSCTPMMVDDRSRIEYIPLPVPSLAMTLTPHQRTVLNYIVEFQQKRGYSPSLADLALAFGVRSKNAIAKVVNVLVREGHLEKDPKGRIKIVDAPQESSAPEPMVLPLFGPISAGFAAPVEEQAEEMLNVEDYLMSGNRAAIFLLRVKGDSMINAGIHEGDLVIVERDAQPKANEA